MKDSGIEWIGKIPEQWDVHPVYLYFDERKNSNYRMQEQNLLSLSYGNIIRKDINTNGGLLPISFTTYNIVEKGDIIIRPTDLQNDKKSLRTGLVKERGIITSAYIALKPKYSHSSRFYHYFLHAADICKVFYNMGNGVRQGLNYSEFSKLQILSPSPDEQETIADYLDKKTSDIDAAIKEAQELIEKYKAYKQSIITEIVTKGLNPNVAMKDSGVEWIGEIPEHWKVVPFRSYIIERAEKNRGEKTRELLALSYALGVTLYRDKVYNMDRVKEDYEDYQLVYENDLVLSPNDIIKGSVYVSKYYGCISPMYNVFSARNAKTHYLPYLSYLLRTKEAGWRFFFIARGIIGGISNTGQYVTRRMTVSRQDLMSFKVLLPPPSEQQAIVDFLDQKCAKIDSIIADKETLISRLQEYKKSIIFEYVTGKKEVPNG